MADPFAWMRHRDLPATRGYLAAERAYYGQQMAPLAGAAGRTGHRTHRQDRAGGRVRPLAAWRLLDFTRTRPGQQYEQFCRAGPAGQPLLVLLDENEVLADPGCAGGYVALGVREVSPDGRLLAYSADFTGDEVYQLRVRDLATGTDLPECIGRTYYGLAWSAGSDQFWYTVTDARYRPYEVWRHQLGTGPDADELVSRRTTSGSRSPSGRPAAGRACSSRRPPGTPARRWPCQRATRARRPSFCCRGRKGPSTGPSTRTVPVGHRELVSGATGHALAVFDTRDMLYPNPPARVPAA